MGIRECRRKGVRVPIIQLVDSHQVLLFSECYATLSGESIFVFYF
jgi:hypothetical protein